MLLGVRRTPVRLYRDNAVRVKKFNEGRQGRIGELRTPSRQRNWFGTIDAMPHLMLRFGKCFRDPFRL